LGGVSLLAREDLEYRSSKTMYGVTEHATAYSSVEINAGTSMHANGANAQTIYLGISPVPALAPPKVRKRQASLLTEMLR
jgi:hypothetical protein